MLLELLANSDVDTLRNLVVFLLLSVVDGLESLLSLDDILVC